MVKRLLVRYRKSKLKRFIDRYEKHLLIAFFIGGFVFDSLTLGRIDRLYDLTILCSHMTLLTVSLYVFNLLPDGKWKHTFLSKNAHYLSFLIQFFFGALSSAYVVYFSRSVSLSKTVFFFIILVGLLLANELLKQRISNKYLQFSIYLFLSITFFSFILPVFTKEMNESIFLLSGGISMIITLSLTLYIYFISPSTREEVHLTKLLSLLFGIYLTINALYFFKVIPPVPLALDKGIVAHEVVREGDHYHVTFARDAWYVFWRSYHPKFEKKPGDPVYIYSSIFAPTDLEKNIFHRWKVFDEPSGDWQVVEDISYPITGGRDGGYRGYTFKSNVWPGKWSVEVLTEEELILGVIDFEIIEKEVLTKKWKSRRF